MTDFRRVGSMPGRGVHKTAMVPVISGPAIFEIGTMTSRVFAIPAVMVLALAFWVVPSVGTRGQGTLGDRFVHPDRGIVADTAAGHAALARADHVVTGAVTGR